MNQATVYWTVNSDGDIFVRGLSILVDEWILNEEGQHESVKVWNG